MNAGGGGGCGGATVGRRRRRGSADPIWVVLRSAIRGERISGLVLEFDERV